MTFKNFLTSEFFGVVLSLIVAVISYFKWKHSYYRRKNLPYLKPSLPLGNLTNPFKLTEKTTWTLKYLYDEMKRRKWSHGGVFIITTPIHVIVDLKLLKSVLTKDFHHFVDRGVYYNERNEPITGNLLTFGGTKWKNLRAKLTPAFSSGKMKQLFQTLLECEDNVLNRIEQDYESKTPLDAKEVLGCFTTDIIGSWAFGLDCNTFKEENSPFRVYGKKAMMSSRKEVLKALFCTNFPKLASVLKMRVLEKDVSDFFTQVVKDTVDYREKNNYARKDFLQLLIELKNMKPETDDDGNSLTMEEIAAQSLLFFLAGFETSTTLMTFTLYELASNQDIQQRVRDEISTVLKKYNGIVTYDAIQELKYMTQVLNESLRKYPPVAFVTRQCVKDYKIPGEDHVLEKGLRILVPIIAIHYDEEYYPDPDNFDPERFNEENSASRKQYTYMPFGEGPRSCIAFRFGMMQAKVAFVWLLRKYKFTVNPRTLHPLKVNVVGFVPNAKGGIWLDVEKL